MSLKLPLRPLHLSIRLEKKQLWKMLGAELRRLRTIPPPVDSGATLPGKGGVSMAYQASETTTRSETSKGETSTDVAKRRNQAKAAGDRADKAAVEEGMKPGTLAAAAARAAAKRKAKSTPTPTPSPTSTPTKKVSMLGGRSMSGRRA